MAGTDKAAVKRDDKGAAKAGSTADAVQRAFDGRRIVKRDRLAKAEIGSENGSSRAHFRGALIEDLVEHPGVRFHIMDHGIAGEAFNAARCNEQDHP